MFCVIISRIYPEHRFTYVTICEIFDSLNINININIISTPFLLIIKSLILTSENVRTFSQYNARWNIPIKWAWITARYNNVVLWLSNKLSLTLSIINHLQQDIISEQSDTKPLVAYLRTGPARGGGLLSQFSPFRYFPHFPLLSKQTLAIEYHVYIWQVSPQLSYGDTCQIWMWFRESNSYFCKIENFAYGEISERSFRNPHPSSREITERWKLV